MVLELAKLNDELDSCQQTASTQLELQVEIEQVLQQKVNVDCIRSNLPSLASMALPTFLPIALLEKFVAIAGHVRVGTEVQVIRFIFYTGRLVQYSTYVRVKISNSNNHHSRQCRLPQYVLQYLAVPLRNPLIRTGDHSQFFVPYASVYRGR